MINNHTIENSAPFSRSPPWHMNPLIMRWKELPANPNGVNSNNTNSNSHQHTTTTTTTTKK